MSTPKNQSVSYAEIEKNVRTFITTATRPLRELYDGAKSGTLPWSRCFILGIFFQVGISRHWDIALLQLRNWDWLYPTNPILFRWYYFITILSPFWMWGIYKAIVKQRFLSKLTQTFQNIGLKNAMGKLPNFIFDKALDSQTRKLRLARVGISPSEFEKKREDLASALHVYVDELRENRAQGTMDFIYGLEPMPRDFIPDTYSFLKANTFLVGTTRSKQYVADLRDTPHLLVAGQTGGGKSTFLRQFITSLYLNNPSYEFSLIDLKGGLEFSLFECLPRVGVIGNVANSVFLLKNIAAEIDTRMKLLKKNRCKDLAQFMAMPREERQFPEDVPPDYRPNRQIIVVDEAAELFLAGGAASTADVQTSRRILSQVARQGRSLGVHLVIATQRPDSRALDPQIKANLTGVLSFKMVNDVSSISVLGTGRATDLPNIPGRGIWKSELEMVEVQTPYLTTDVAEELLKGFYVKKPESEPDASNEKQNPATETVGKHEQLGKE